MDTTIIDECDEMSFADVPFPKTVGRLIEAGVRSYRADLIGCRKAYYDAGTGAYETPIPLEPAPIGSAFEEATVVGALRAIQRGEIGYAEFLRRIMGGGCASYCVYLQGRKAVYFGRDGDFYVENFPAAKT